MMCVCLLFVLCVVLVSLVQAWRRRCSAGYLIAVKLPEFVACVLVDAERGPSVTARANCDREAALLPGNVPELTRLLAVLG